MIIRPPVYKNVEIMSNEELIKERKLLCREIASTEKSKMSTGNFVLWIEDESIIYAWQIERLEAILCEIKRRMENAEWIFSDEHNF